VTQESLVHARLSVSPEWVSKIFTGLAKSHGLWETGLVKKPELTGTGWLGPRDEMDRASHRFGKCSECNEIICVEKAVADGPITQRETSKMLSKAFDRHVKLNHPENYNQAASRTTNNYDT